MSELAPAPQEPSADEATESPVERAELRLVTLQELADIGMEMARELQPDKDADDASPEGKAERRDAVVAFGPLSRAIRLTLALESDADRELRDLMAGAPPMSEPAPAPLDPSDDEAPDTPVERAERRLSMLQELADFGMELARGLQPDEDADDTSPEGRAERRDAIMAFGPLSRAIRLTLALEARADRELRDLIAGVDGAAPDRKVKTDPRAPEPPVDWASLRRFEAVSSRINQLINHDAETVEAFNELMEAASERLEQERDWYRADRPPRESVERICRDLGLKPDWSRWDGDGWIYDGVYGVKHNTPSLEDILKEAGIAPKTAPARAPPPHIRK